MINQRVLRILELIVILIVAYISTNACAYMAMQQVRPGWHTTVLSPVMARVEFFKFVLVLVFFILLIIAQLIRIYRS